MHFGAESFIVRLSGHAMEPVFLDGEYLYVDPDEPAEPGRHIWVHDDGTGESTVRLMVEEDGRRVLRALNPGWPEWTLDHDNETMIQGVVVFAGRGV